MYPSSVPSILRPCGPHLRHHRPRRRRRPDPLQIPAPKTHRRLLLRRRQRRRPQPRRQARRRLRPLLVRRAGLQDQARDLSAQAAEQRGYADNFFNWVYDFNGDGWNDVLRRRLPRHAGLRLRKPGHGRLRKHWPKHEVFDRSPTSRRTSSNIVGDEQPGTRLHASRASSGSPRSTAKEPFKKWTFHAISR